MEEEDAVDRELGIVARDADLARRVERNLLEGVAVGDAVDEGNDEVEARREHGVELAEALDHPRGLLGHDLDGLERKEHRHDDEHERKDEKAADVHFFNDSV